jgi:hypothetical protein
MFRNRSYHHHRYRRRRARRETVYADAIDVARVESSRASNVFAITPGWLWSVTHPCLARLVAACPPGRHEVTNTESAIGATALVVTRVLV